MVTKEELTKQLNAIEKAAESVGFTPYLAKKRDRLYKQLWRIK